MLEVVSSFIIYFITHLLDCSVFSKLIGTKFKIDIKFIVLISIFSFLNIYAGLQYGSLVKLIITNLITFILFLLIYKQTMYKTLIGTIFTFIGVVLSESFFSVIAFEIFNINTISFMNSLFGLIVINFSIFIIYLLIFKIKFVVSFISKIMKWYEESKLLNLISLFIIVISICYVIGYKIIFDIFALNITFLLFNILVGIIIFIGGYFKEKSSNNKLTIEYDQLLDYVKTYEEEVVDKSKKQHEYKNQLIIIDDMIPKTNRKAKDYLKKVLNNVEDITDNDWLVKLKNLPSGGIKGLVHFKIKKMIENKISVYIDVDKKLSKKDNWVNVDKNLEDVSRILGVYLDNAIEAASKAKDKQIIIEFINGEDSIEFVLSNSYSGNISFAELDKEGYSTKGKNRGVGLSLVKDIIKNNKLLEQSREINGKFYVQKLYIKK